MTTRISALALEVVALVVAAGFLPSGCSDGGISPSGARWYSHDGTDWHPDGTPGDTPPLGDLEGRIYVMGEESTIRAEEFSLVTWPEFVDVPTDVTVAETQPGRLGTIAFLVPRGALESRWYAIRWLGEPQSHIEVRGVPLADGSVIWRFHAIDAPGSAAPPVPTHLCADRFCE